MKHDTKPGTIPYLDVFEERELPNFGYEIGKIQHGRHAEKLKLC